MMQPDVREPKRDAEGREGRWKEKIWRFKNKMEVWHDG